MRGKQHEKLKEAALDGITPADAGKTAGMYTTRTAPGGSPPQMRGKRMRFNYRFDFVGITPAGAGKTRGRTVD